MYLIYNSVKCDCVRFESFAFNKWNLDVREVRNGPIIFRPSYVRFVINSVHIFYQFW